MCERILAQTVRHGLFVLDLATGVTLGNFKKASGKPYCASFVTASPSTSHVALSTSILAVADVSQPFLHILSLDRLEASAHSHSVPEPVVSVAFSPCGTFCFSGGASGNLYVWAMASGQLVRCWRGHYRAVTCIAVSPNGSYLITGSEDSVVSCYAMEDILARADDTHLPVEAEPQRLHRWTAHSMPIVSMALSNLSGQHWVVVTASLDRTVHVWRPHHDSPIASYIFPCHIRHVCTNPSSMECYACGADSKIYIVDLASQLLENDGSGYMGKLRAPSFVACKAAADIATQLSGHEAAVVCCGCSADGSTLVSCGEDGIRIWDILSRQVIKHLPALGDMVTSVRLFCEDPLTRMSKQKKPFMFSDHAPLSIFPPLQPLKRVPVATAPAVLLSTVHRGEQLRQELMRTLDSLEMTPLDKGRSCRVAPWQDDAQSFFGSIARTVNVFQTAEMQARARQLKAEHEEYASTVQDLFGTLCLIEEETGTGADSWNNASRQSEISSDILYQDPLAWLQKTVPTEGKVDTAKNCALLQNKYPYVDRSYAVSRCVSTDTDSEDQQQTLTADSFDEEEEEEKGSFRHDDNVVYEEDSGSQDISARATEDDEELQRLDRSSSSEAESEALADHTVLSPRRAVPDTASYAITKRRRRLESLLPSTAVRTESCELITGQSKQRFEAECYPSPSLVSPSRQPFLRNAFERHRKLRVSAAMSRRLRLIQWLSHKASNYANTS